MALSVMGKLFYIAKIRIIFDIASIFGEDRLLEDSLKLFLTVFADMRPVIVNVAI
jgi:hypothetical protein